MCLFSCHTRKKTKSLSEMLINLPPAVNICIKDGSNLRTAVTPRTVVKIPSSNQGFSHFTTGGSNPPHLHNLSILSDDFDKPCTFKVIVSKIRSSDQPLGSRIVCLSPTLSYF